MDDSAIKSVMSGIYIITKKLNVRRLRFTGVTALFPQGPFPGFRAWSLTVALASYYHQLHSPKTEAKAQRGEASDLPVRERRSPFHE